LFALDILVLLYVLEVLYQDGSASGILGILVLLCILIGSLDELVQKQLVPETTGDKSIDDNEESVDAYSWIMRGKEAGVLLSLVGLVCPRYITCSISPVAHLIEPAQEYRAPSNTSWAVVEL